MNRILFIILAAAGSAFLVAEVANAQGIFGPVPTLSEIIEAGGQDGDGGLFGPTPTLSEIIEAQQSGGNGGSGIFGPVPTLSEMLGDY